MKHRWLGAIFVAMLLGAAMAGAQENGGISLKPVIKGKASANGGAQNGGISLKPVIKGQNGEQPTRRETPERVAEPEPTPAPTPRPAATPTPQAQRAPEPERFDLERVLTGAPNEINRTQLREYVLEHRGEPDAARAMLRIGEISEALGQSGAAEEAYRLAAEMALDDRVTSAATVALARMAPDGGAEAPATAVAPDLDALGAAAIERLLAQDYEQAAGLWAEMDAALATPAQPMPAEVANAAEAKLIFGQALTAELTGDAEQARRLYAQVVRRHASGDEAKLAEVRLRDLDAGLSEE